MTMKLKIYKNAEEAAAILARGGFEDEELAKSVREIVRCVRDGEKPQVTRDSSKPRKPIRNAGVTL